MNPMKIIKLFCILFFVHAGMTVHGQQVLQFSVEKNRNQNVDIAKYLSDYQVLALDKNLMVKLWKIESQEVSIDIPSHSTSSLHSTPNITIKFEKIEVVSRSFYAKTADNQLIDFSAHQYYKGKVEGSSNSSAVLIVSADEIRLFYKLGNQSFRIKQYTDGTYIHYDVLKYTSERNFSCGVDQEIESVKAGHSTQYASRTTSTLNDTLLIYMEVDNNAFQDLGNHVTNSINWALDLFADVLILYDEINIPIQVSGIKIWNIPDPYISTSSTEALTIFNDSLVAQGFPGHLGHLMSTRGYVDFSGGGFIDALCDCDESAAVSGHLDPEIIPLPDYSFNLNVLSHEIGHNIGSRHTHACAWNGDNTQIDDCGNIVPPVPEGADCYDENNPILPNNGEGTIMSYCHAFGVNIGITLEFHPQVADTLFNYFSDFINDVSCDTICGSLGCAQIITSETDLMDQPLNPIFNWSPGYMAEGYLFTIIALESNKTTIFDVGNVLSYQILDLEYCKAYQIKLHPYNSTDTLQTCFPLTFSTLEYNIDIQCVDIISHEDSIVYEELTTQFEWSNSTDTINGYLLTMGTSEGGVEILDSTFIYQETAYNVGAATEVSNEVHVSVVPFYQCDTLHTASYCNGSSYTINHPACTLIEEMILPDNTTDGDNFGHSIDIHKNMMAVGAPDAFNGTGTSGGVYIFTDTAGEWGQDTVIYPPTGIASDFGKIVSIFENHLWVTNLDHVFVYEKIAGVWTHQQTYNETFIEDIDILDSMVLIGQMFPNDGLATLFTLSDTGWLETQQFYPYPELFAGPDRFGSAVSLAKDQMAIGARGAGHVYLYEKDSTWNFKKRLDSPQGYNGRQFGKSVSIVSNHLMVGMPNEDFTDEEAGVALYYFYDGKNWEIKDTLTPADGMAIDHFGFNLEMNDGYAIIGAKDADPFGDKSGAAYYFYRIGDQWTQKTKITNDMGTNGDLLGTSVALYEAMYAVGAPDEYNDDNGYMLIYDCSIPECISTTSPADGEIGVSLDADISWSEASDADGYILFLGTCFGCTDVLDSLDVGNSSSYEIDTLYYETNYYLTIYPYNERGLKTDCFETYFFTEEIPIVDCPDVFSPPDAAFEIMTNTSISWKSVEGALGYKFYAGTCFECIDITDTIDLNLDTIYTPSTPLPFFTDIYYNVIPYNQFADADACLSNYFTTDMEITCSSVSNIANGQTDVSSNPTLYWNPSGTATGYKVVSGYCESCNDILDSIDVGNTTEYSLTNLTYASTVYFQVIPYDEDEEIVTCETLFFMVEDPRPDCEPLGLPIHESSQNDIYSNFNWTLSGEADGYLVVAGTCDTCFNIVDTTDVGFSNVFDPGPLPYLDSIFVQIIPYNAFGTQTDCMRSWFVTDSLPCPILIDPFPFATEVDINIDVSWNSIPQVLGYKITMGSCSACMDIADAVDIGMDTIFDPGILTEEDTFYIQLIAYTAVLESTICDTSYFVTACPSCPTCDDGIMNGDETAIDCGGNECLPCPTCDDGIQNGDETFVDCGGGSCDICPSSCGYTFYDDGGLAHDHASLDTIAWQLCPDDDDSRIMIEIDTLRLGNNAGLSFYDGPDQSTVIQNYYGTTFDIKVASHHSTGCITVVLKSWGEDTDQGWEAELSCISACGMVTNNSYNDIGSLVENISCVEDGDTILFAPVLDGDTIHLLNPVFASKSVYIIGPIDTSLCIDASNSISALSIGFNRTVHISNLSILAGEGAVSEFFGSLFITPRAFDISGTLHMKDCTIYDYQGMYNPSTMLIKVTGALYIDNEVTLKE